MPVYNWKGDISYQPKKTKKVKTVGDIVEVVKDEQYPRPVRAKGSHHSVTKCVDAEGGTLLDMTGMNQIMQIDRNAMTITMQAGVLLGDAAKVLEQMGLQFYVNVELGNLTAGSGACCGTKKASYCVNGVFEYGQVSSYVDGFKIVKADGTELVVDKSQPSLLEAMRSSYGMLGVIHEVTYRIKPLSSMNFSHKVYRLEKFKQDFDKILTNGSTMLYLFPLLDTVVVESRWEGTGPIEKCNAWKFRNFAWKTGVPFFGKISGKLPFSFLRRALLASLDAMVILALYFLRGANTSPVDQIVRYPEKGGFTSYTFSLWAFERSDYLVALDAYFQLCREHKRKYRCDMPSVGYAIEADESSLFSYTREGFSLTLDPVSTGGPGWENFLEEFNELCASKNGKPLFNQTPGIKTEHVKKAFDVHLKRFLMLRKQYDPDDRFYTDWFKEIFGERRVSTSLDGS